MLVPLGGSKFPLSSSGIVLWKFETNEISWGNKLEAPRDRFETAHSSPKSNRDGNVASRSSGLA